MNAAEAAIFYFGRALCALPAPVQRAIGGGPPDLEPEVAVFRRLGEMVAPKRESAQALRARQNRMARIVGGPSDGLPARDLVIAGSLRARHYPAAAGAPLLVYLHGGGFVFGDVDTHDAPCRILRRHGGMHVLSVEYRLAPEHAFPAAVDDARAALAWAHEHATELGAGAGKVAIGGDSAGANLSAVAAQLAAKDGGPAPIAQLLVYPAVDRRKPWPSLASFASGFYLTRDAIDWFHEQYRQGGTPDARLNPLAADDLRGLAPALVVTAGFDPLRDEGEAYAAALARAGNAVTLRRFDGMVHGFFNMVGLSPACRSAVVEIAGATRMLVNR